MSPYKTNHSAHQMNTLQEYTDSEGRIFFYEQGRRVYVDGGKDREIPVPFTPTPKEEPEEFSWKHLQFVKAIQDAGFVVEDDESRDGPFRLACMSRKNDRFWIALGRYYWFIGNWAGHFYRSHGRGSLAGNLPVLAAESARVTTTLRSGADTLADID